MTKNEIRRSILKIRDSQSPEEILEKSKKIKERLFSLEDFIKAKNILFYASFRTEVKTDIIIVEALKQKRVFLPKVMGKNLEIFEVKTFNEIKLGFCGIPEPITERPVKLADIELVIVPGVCFDIRGFRIGYGGGYYDRLLPKLTSQKIGLAFNFQIIDKIPNTPQDIKVDMVVSDVTTHNFAIILGENPKN